MRDDDLTHLLSPVDVSAFVAGHWEREPLHIPGAPAKVERWSYDRAAFFQALETRGALAGRVKTQFYDLAGRDREQPIDPRLARTMFDAGMTICVERFEEGDARLGALAASAKQSLGHGGAVTVNCYVSPHDKGFGLHFDSQSVFIIQLDGQKRWRYSAAPAMVGPPGAVTAEAEDLDRFQRAWPWAEISPPDESTLRETTLRVGDVLYLPAGTWHAARAESHSVALTLTVMPHAARHVVVDLLRKILIADPEWRAYVPLSPAHALPAVGLPPALEQFFAHKLEQLRRRVGELTPAELALHWRTDLTTVAAPPPVANVEILPEALLRVGEPVGLIDHPRNDAVVLFAGAVTMELPADNRTFLLHVVRRKQFRAQEAMSFCEPEETLEWDDVREALEVLVEAGALAAGRG